MLRPMKLTIAPFLLVCVLGSSEPATAQSLDQRASSALDAKHHGKLVDGITTALVGVALVDSVYQQRTQTASVWKRIALHEAIAVGTTVALAETVKRLTHRQRPDGSNDQSFFSEHTALAALSLGQLPKTTIPIVVTFGVGVGRISAQKHYPSDVLAGAGVGYLVGRLTR